MQALFDEHGKKVREARPGEFVTITGFKSKPEPGAFIQATTKKKAEKAQKFRENEQKKQLQQQLMAQSGGDEQESDFNRKVIEKKIAMGFYKLDKQQRVHFERMLEAKRLEELEITKGSSLNFLIK